MLPWLEVDDHNLKVAGSNPSHATNSIDKTFTYQYIAGPYFDLKIMPQ